jgi:CHASE2 domain-containing sensor protein
VHALTAWHVIGEDLRRRAAEVLIKMGIWVAVFVVGLVGASVAWRRTSPTRTINAGQVSQSWLREQRAEKQNPFQS